MADPLVSALTLNFRSPQPAVQCALSFLQQTMADRMEVIVIDNHSEDDSVGVLRNRLRTHDAVRIVETPGNGGFGRGYNTGVQYSRGEYLLINNPDKELQPDGVERLVAALQADPSIGIIAPRLMHRDGTRRYSARAFPKPLDVLAKRTFLQSVFPGRLRRYLQLDADPDRQRDADWVVGGCFMMRRDLFLSLGGFDDRFFLFFEDTDLCRRCREQGYRVVYYPDVTAYDRKKRLSEGGLWTLLSTKVGRAHIMSGIRYFLKWGVRLPENSPSSC